VTAGNPWRLEITKPALKDLKRLDEPVRQRILTALDGLEHEPAAGDIKHLTNSRPPQWRLRVGDWRVRFARDPDTRTVRILRVLPRGRAYRD
jgi:mRNA interferase RelE/StbE